jgi:mannose-6-phosphate isomerase-like protein (cupin superfamily)
MLIKDINQCDLITAGDGTQLKELFNPEKDKINVAYSLAEAVLRPGEHSFRHKLDSSEVYYLLTGSGEIYINDEMENVHAGQAIYIPACSIQYLKNTGDVDLKFLCIVEPAWKKEYETIVRHE